MMVITTGAPVGASSHDAEVWEFIYEENDSTLRFIEGLRGVRQHKIFLRLRLTSPLSLLMHVVVSSINADMYIYIKIYWNIFFACEISTSKDLPVAGEQPQGALSTEQTTPKKQQRFWWVPKKKEKKITIVPGCVTTLAFEPKRNFCSKIIVGADRTCTWLRNYVV